MKNYLFEYWDSGNIKEIKIKNEKELYEYLQKRHEEKLEEKVSIYELPESCILDFS